MPRKKICKECYYINDIDASYCINCDADLELENKFERIPVKRGEKCHYYNLITKEFTDVPPFEPKKTENKVNIEEETVEIAEVEEKEELEVTNESNNENMVKICPFCQHENDKDATTCSNCQTFLFNVKPQVKEEQVEEIVENNFEEQEDVSNDSEKYSLLFGLDDENEIPLVFDNNNRFWLGRAHQSFLDIECLRYVSSNHCYIQKSDEGTYELYEDIFRPSTNGTYVRTTGNRNVRVIPGKGVKLTNGTVFYLAKLPVLFKKDL